jgi:hypothetical protein
MFHGKYRFKEPGRIFQKKETIAGNSRDRRRDIRN